MYVIDFDNLLHGGGVGGKTQKTVNSTSFSLQFLLKPPVKVVQVRESKEDSERVGNSPEHLMFTNQQKPMEPGILTQMPFVARWPPGNMTF